MKPIITSLLDTDLYKLTMLSVYYAKFSNCTASFSFKDRTRKIPTDEQFVRDLETQLDNLAELTFTEEELNYLFRLRFMKDKIAFKYFLRNFKLHRDDISVRIGKYVDGEELIIETKETGLMYASMWEIYVLSIVNELYGQRQQCFQSIQTANCQEIINQYENVPFAFCEFGTRRRFSKEFQSDIVHEFGKLSKIKNHNLNGKFLGTSNVHLARINDITPMGTFAHEYLCLGQGLKDVPIAKSQEYMLKHWLEHFEGDLGICLSDNLGTDKFLKDFSRLYAKTFDGLRHDSGDPIQWAEQMIAMYKGYNIDPMTKTLFFSDGLNVETATDIYNKLNGRCRPAFGIGTSLTNPICPTEVVMKMVSANGRPVAKLSNNSGKTMCSDREYIAYLQSAISYN